MDLQKQYASVEIKLNRLHSQKAALQYKLKLREESARKARTRTLIQMGGLLELTPLPSLCDISLGDDLQLDYPDKAAILLGMLSELANDRPNILSDDDIARFREIGVRILKKNAV
jgi:hypothetical protein